MVDNRPELSVAIVEALAAWSAAEIELTQLFARLADLQTIQNGRYHKKAHLIFDTIISFETRLDIVDALMAEEGLSELELETWNRCSARLRKLYKRRHSMAHFVLMGVTTNDKAEYQISPFFTIGAAMRQQAKSLSITQIMERRAHFHEMVLAISYFEWGALERRGLHLDNPMPEPPLVARFRALASQILEERGHKPKPSDPLSEPETDP
jgi:hypothetical protein